MLHVCVSEPTHSSPSDVEKRKIEELKRAHVLLMAFCGAVASTSVQRYVWMWSLSQQWQDCDVRGFTDRVHP